MDTPPIEEFLTLLGVKGHMLDGKTIELTVLDFHLMALRSMSGLNNLTLEQLIVKVAGWLADSGYANYLPVPTPDRKQVSLVPLMTQYLRFSDEHVVQVRLDQQLEIIVLPWPLVRTVDDQIVATFAYEGETVTLFPGMVRSRFYTEAGLFSTNVSAPCRVQIATNSTEPTAEAEFFFRISPLNNKETHND